MRNYIILNGVNSNTITGLLISTLPPITKPKIRTQTEEIDGRDGDIVTTLGYSAYDKEIEIGLYGGFDINQVIAYFNTEGTVVFSNENDKYYNYQIIDQIDYEKLIRFKKAKVKMHVQPFKYPLEETPVDITIETVSSEGETMSINNTANAPITLALKGNTSQDGTPTPTAPVEVNTVTGRQEINVIGKNLFNKDTTTTQVGYFNSSGAVVSGGESTVTTSYIPILPNTNITLSGFIVNRICYYDKNKNFIERSEVITGQPYTFNKNAYYIRIQGGTAVFDINKFQLEVGSATTYEAYQGQSYELDLGKNVFDGINREIFISAGANQCNTYTGNVGGYVIVNGGKYTISTTETQSKYRVACINSIPSSTLATCYNGVNKDNTKDTITIDTGNYKYLLIYATDLSKIQVERGATASSFAPYKTPIEVCYIPNTEYQDYFYKNNNTWYIKKEIGKVTLTGATAENWGKNTSYTNNTRFTSFGTTLSKTTPLLSDYFVEGTGGTDTTNIDTNGTTGQLMVTIPNSIATGVDALQTWLASNNVNIYYVLDTPTDEEITDATLIGQLNTIEANARSYDTITNISQNTPNKPFIINATAVKKGTDTGTVNNLGNIYAKPTIDIEGSGIADIYLNNNQIFSVDLSTFNECIIDTANLEAYNPDTSQLMNRQVTGDYSNFNITVGENTVKISGSVTKATISNYTRWL